MQRGGFATEQDARAALEQTLEKLRRRGRIGRVPTLAEFVDEYLAQHEASPSLGEGGPARRSPFEAAHAGGINTSSCCSGLGYCLRGVTDAENGKTEPFRVAFA